jgi:hypothetical protein
MLNIEKINKLFREREELLKFLDESQAEFARQIEDASLMVERGQCTKEQFFTYFKETKKREEEFEAPTVKRLKTNTEEIKQNSMVSPLEFAKLIEIGLYSNHRFDQLYRGFKRGSKYKPGDKLTQRADFQGFYKMWEKEGTAMAFMPADLSPTAKISINDKNSLIFHVTEATLEEHAVDWGRSLIRDELISIFEDPRMAEIGKNKPEDMFIPFRLSITGQADEFHRNEFNNDVARGIFEYLNIVPVMKPAQALKGNKKSSISALVRE